eukprot:7387463-Prymnesium_polylepis.1
MPGACLGRWAARRGRICANACALGLAVPRALTGNRHLLRRRAGGCAHARLFSLHPRQHRLPAARAAADSSQRRRVAARATHLAPRGQEGRASLRGGAAELDVQELGLLLRAARARSAPRRPRWNGALA